MKDLFSVIAKMERGQLSPEEVQALKQQIEQDPDFAAHFQREWYAFKAIEAAGDRELKQALLNKSAPLPSNNTHLIRGMRLAPILAVAAAVLLLLVFFPFNSSAPTTPQEAFNQYMDVPVHTSRGASPQTEVDTWDKALRLYLSGNYEQAQQTLVPLVQTPTFSHFSEASLYLGVCYLKMQQPENALNALSQVRKGSAFFQEAKWFSALGYLQQEKLQEATSVLQEISELPYHYKRAEATELLTLLAKWQ